MDNGKEHEYYSILQVTEGATLEEIHKQYMHLSALYHPKNNPGEDKWCNKLLCRLEEAYQYLQMKHSGVISNSTTLDDSVKIPTFDRVDRQRKYEPWRPDVPYDVTRPFQTPPSVPTEINRTIHPSRKNDAARTIGMVVASIVIGATSMFCVLVYKNPSQATPTHSSIGNNNTDRLYHVRKGNAHDIKVKSHAR